MIYPRECPCAFEKNVYCADFQCNVLYLSVKPFGVMFHLKPVSFLIFCLGDPSIGVSAVFKSPTIIILLLIYLFMSINVCSMYLGASMLTAQIFTIVLSSFGLSP